MRGVLGAAGALLLGLAVALPVRPVWAEDAHRHCPPAGPGNSFTFFAAKQNAGDDKARLDTLAGSVAKDPTPVCILALVDPHDAGYSKKLAIRRVLWVRENLIGKGVPPTLIAAELRPAAPDQDKASLREVSVIIGR